jgi:OHCU decarboxylase
LNERLAWFNDLAQADAENVLYGCLANRTWAARVAAGRPFEHVESLLAMADIASAEFSEREWMDAFAAHPRIGERGGDAPATSDGEQRRVMHASHETLAALDAENRRYEERFGHVFLIAASGRGAEEILGELRRRMSNDPVTELQEAAREQRRIARLRLEKVLSA